MQYGSGKYHDEERGYELIPEKNEWLRRSEPDRPISNSFSAPTQSLLQKWLREVHNIDVNVLPYNTNKKEYEVCVDLAVTTWSGSKTYEEALEIGLQESLKLIPNV